MVHVQCCSWLLVLVLPGDGLSHSHSHNLASLHGAHALSLERERARRKVETTATELWYFLNARIKELTSASASGLVNTMVKNMKSDLQGYQT